ncbi:astakine-like isoform X2 [Procambarus clarkii]|uniref:astakine-like isoform X2 n=1 Tax=Procambarus clarkii TaxID=6728 RepID=UPI003743A901
MKMRGVSEAVVVSVGVFTLMLGMALAGSCVSDEPDCGPSECCIEGRPRKCAPLGEVDDRCHVYTQAPVRGVYSSTCPCSPGLVCTRPSGTCQIPGVHSPDPYY